MITNLKSYIKPGGHILIGDVYLQSESAKSVYSQFGTFQATTAGYLANGDDLILRIDYQDSLWGADYQRTREVALVALRQCANQKEHQLIQRYLDCLEEDEVNDKTCLGLAIWVLKIRK